MANHKSAKKRIRQSEKRRQANKSFLSSVHTAIKTLRKAVAEGKPAEEVQKLYRQTQSLIAKSAVKGLVHRNKGARQISGISKLLKS